MVISRKINKGFSKLEQVDDTNHYRAFMYYVKGITDRISRPLY